MVKPSSVIFFLILSFMSNLMQLFQDLSNFIQLDIHISLCISKHSSSGYISLLRRYIHLNITLLLTQPFLGTGFYENLFVSLPTVLTLVTAPFDYPLSYLYLIWILYFRTTLLALLYAFFSSLNIM